MTPRQIFKGSESISLTELFGNMVKCLWIIAIFMTAECKVLYHLFASFKNVERFDSSGAGPSRI